MVVRPMDQVQMVLIALVVLLRLGLLGFESAVLLLRLLFRTHRALGFLRLPLLLLELLHLIVEELGVGVNDQRVVFLVHGYG